MNNKSIIALIAGILLLMTAFATLWGTMRANEIEPAEATKLGVVWTSGDPEVANKVCFMYTHNAKLRGWFDEVTLIVWGPSQKLLTENESLQARIKAMAEDGVVLKACKACADIYELDDKLTEIGVEVKYMGIELSDMLQGDYEVITF